MFHIIWRSGRVQGREKEICIFTTVRSRLAGGIGFVADARRINVGLSRARSSLLVVGNAAALRKDAKWAGVVSYADSIGRAPPPHSLCYRRHRCCCT